MSRMCVAAAYSQFSPNVFHLQAVAGRDEARVVLFVTILVRLLLRQLLVQLDDVLEVAALETDFRFRFI